MMTQTIEIRDQYQVILHIHNPIQDSMLANIKSELAGYLREKLKNTALNVIGELKEVDERKKIYSQREKFEYLLARNPMLKELKDRLGLDTDF